VIIRAHTRAQRWLTLSLSLSAAIAASACCSAARREESRNVKSAAAASESHPENPLLRPWSGPYGGVPAFAGVRVSDFEPALEQAMAEHGIANVHIVGERWPMRTPPAADVALMAHIGYDVEDIGSFLGCMEATVRRLCVAVLMAPSPPHLAEPFWPPIHGEARVPLPSLSEFLVLLGARERFFEVRLLDREPVTYADRDASLPWLYQQLFVAPDTDKGQRLAGLARETMAAREGRWALSWAPGVLGIVTWRPR